MMMVIMVVTIMTMRDRQTNRKTDRHVPDSSSDTLRMPHASPCKHSNPKHKATDTSPHKPTAAVKCGHPLLSAAVIQINIHVKLHTVGEAMFPVFQFYSQEGIVALGKAHPRFTPSLRSLRKVALETVLVFVWLNTDRSRPRWVEHRPLPFSAPVIFMLSML